MEGSQQNLQILSHKLENQVMVFSEWIRQLIIPFWFFSVQVRTKPYRLLFPSGMSQMISVQWMHRLSWLFCQLSEPELLQLACFLLPSRSDGSVSGSVGEDASWKNESHKPAWKSHRALSRWMYNFPVKKWIYNLIYYNVWYQTLQIVRWGVGDPMLAFGQKQTDNIAHHHGVEKCTAWQAGS